jgi:zinc protease
MGATYTPTYSTLNLRTLQPLTLVVSCTVETQPAHSERVAKAMRHCITTLLREGVTADELERARLPLIQSEEASQVTNAWWLEQLVHAQSNTQFLAGMVDRPSRYRAITSEQLNTFARQLFVDANCCEIHAIPK